MVANPLFDLLPPIGDGDGCQCVPTLPEETQPAPTALPPVSEEFGGELVTYPDWRREELARKYSDDEPIERERGFYHPYG